MSNELRATEIAEPPVETKPERISAPRTVAARSRDDAPPATEAATMGPPKSTFREYFESAVVTIIMALFGMTFIVQAVKVPTGSMQNTIMIGDQLLVNKFVFAPGPIVPFLPQTVIERGDVIVFKYPGNQFDASEDLGDPTNTPYINNFVKRVVGLPGDRVEVRGAQVYINDQPLPENIVPVRNRNEQITDAPLVDLNGRVAQRVNGEPYTVYYNQRTVQASERGDDLSSSDFHYAVDGQTTTVPEGSYFVMGDNRDDSADGRKWGFVPRELIVGRAMFVYWSYDMSAPSHPTPIIGRVIDFFTNTRWSRTGTLVR